jgi:hypothetical protein
MTSDEYKLWKRANLRLELRRERADGPCRDCSPDFAAEMLAVGQCDGTPGERRYMTLRPFGWAYATEAERTAARRATWRESKRRRYERQRAAVA